MILRRAITRPLEIKLSENPQLQNGDNPPVQVLRVGTFNHPKYGEFTITTQTLSEMVKNFNDKVRGVDIAFDYFHDSDKEASGWPTALILTEGGTELWAKMDWTPKARKMLSEREVRYFSPDFAFVWKDPETGVSYNNVLFGGGLTNRPFVKEMAAIVADEPGDHSMTEIEKLAKLVEESTAATKKLAEDQAELRKKLAEVAPASKDDADADDSDEDDDDDDDDDDDSDDETSPKAKIKAMEKKMAEMAEAHGNLQKAHEKLMAEMADSQKAKALSEKTAAFHVLLSEGKACAAQKDSYLKGDMAEFVKLSQPVNLNGRGSNDDVDPADAKSPEKIMQLAEEKMGKAKAAGTALDFGDAVSQVRKELGIRT